MANFFAKSNPSEYIEVVTPDGEGFIRLRKTISKGDVNGLYKQSPRGDDDRNGVISFSEKLSELLILGWSFEDEQGNQKPFNIADFRALEAPAAAWIEKEVGKHFEGLTKNVNGEDEEKKPSE